MFGIMYSSSWILWPSSQFPGWQGWWWTQYCLRWFDTRWLPIAQLVSQCATCQLTLLTSQKTSLSANIFRIGLFATHAQFWRSVPGPFLQSLSWQNTWHVLNSAPPLFNFWVLFLLWSLLCRLCWQVLVLFALAGPACTTCLCLTN